MRKVTIAGILTILIISVISVSAFFTLFPSGNQTLGDFMNLILSLTNIIMVLVVVITTSSQLREMANARLMQTQPFPAVRPSLKSYIENLSFFHGGPESRTALMRRIFFCFEVENIGNGPIIALDIVPKLTYVGERGETLKIEPVWERIDSLKENEKKEVDVMFVPKTESDIVQNIMQRFISEEAPCGEFPSSFIQFTILYRNVLGACFKQQMLFDVFLYEEDEEKIKSCLKLLETARIDYSEKMKKHNSLRKTDEEKAREFLQNLNEEISKKDGCDKVYFQAVPRHGHFSIKSISESDYKKEMKSRGYGQAMYATKTEEFYKVTEESKNQ